MASETPEMIHAKNAIGTLQSIIAKMERAAAPREPTADDCATLRRIFARLSEEGDRDIRAMLSEAVKRALLPGAAELAELRAEVERLNTELHGIDIALGNRAALDDCHDRKSKVALACRVAGESDKLMIEVERLRADAAFHDGAILGWSNRVQAAEARAEKAEAALADVRESCRIEKARQLADMVRAGWRNISVELDGETWSLGHWMGELARLRRAAALAAATAAPEAPRYWPPEKAPDRDRCSGQGGFGGGELHDVPAWRVEVDGLIYARCADHPPPGYVPKPEPAPSSAGETLRDRDARAAMRLLMRDASSGHVAMNAQSIARRAFEQAAAMAAERGKP